MRIRAYTVHAPADNAAAPEKVAFVKDGFSWPALFAPILWILWHRLWLTLVAYMIFVLVVAWTGRLISDEAAAIVAILSSLLFALEANNIRRMSLANRGWSDLGASSGQNLDEAELRFFDKWRGANAASEAAAKPIARARDARLSGSEGPILGLFPEPER